MGYRSNECVVISALVTWKNRFIFGWLIYEHDRRRCCCWSTIRHYDRVMCAISSSARPRWNEIFTYLQTTICCRRKFAIHNYFRSVSSHHHPVIALIQVRAWQIRWNLRENVRCRCAKIAGISATLSSQNILLHEFSAVRSTIGRRTVHTNKSPGIF